MHVPERVQWGMREGTVTYAQRLAAAGYQTGYVGKWHAAWLKGPLDYGYRHASFVTASREVLARMNVRPEDDFRRVAAQYPTRLHDQRVVHWVGGDEWPVWQEHDGPMEGRRMHFLASRAIAVLEELAGSDAPWLMEAHFPEPHDPFAPHVEFARRYDPNDVPLPQNWREAYENKPAMKRWRGLTTRTTGGGGIMPAATCLTPIVRQLRSRPGFEAET